MNDTNSLSHMSRKCKYHIVFAPKYRRKVFYGEKRREVGEILRALFNWKKIKIIEKNIGHATSAFTLNVYGHVSEKMKEDSAARMQA